MSTYRPPRWNEPMSRSAIGSLVCAKAADAADAMSIATNKRRMMSSLSEAPIVAPSPRRRGEGAITTALVRQSFAGEPLLDQIGDLITVPVHHHHVGVALDADVGQIDHIDAAAGSLEHARIIDTALANLRPARMILGVVAVDDHHRGRLDGGHLVAVAASGRLYGHQRLDLVGPRRQRLEAERTRLAVHQDYARAHLVDQREIAGHDWLVGAEPARHTLLHELLVGLGRKLR